MQYTTYNGFGFEWIEIAPKYFLMLNAQAFVCNDTSDSSALEMSCLNISFKKDML